MRFVALLLLTAGPNVASVGAADWPQWRGPNRDGKSADTGVSAPWPADGPKLAWKLDSVGDGYGQVAVVGDRVYLVGAEGKKVGAKEFVLCLSAADGKEQWRTPLATSSTSFADRWGGGPRSTPTVAGGKVYALGAGGDLACLDAATGKPVWHKTMADLGGVSPGQPWWGYSESPLVDEGKVVVTPGAKSGMVALDAATGEERWKCPGITEPPGYSSAVVAVVGGVRLYVQQTSAKAVGVRASDGKLLFRTGELERRTAVIPTPVVAGDLAFFTAGYGAGSELYKLAPDGQGGVTATKQYSQNKVLVNHHGGVIELDGFIYGHSDAKNRWVCFDYKAGAKEPVWTDEEKGPGKGSITYADGHFYLYGEGKGELVRIKATKDGFQEAGRFTIPKTSADRKGTQGKVWPHPVVANGKLYLRDYELLFVYDLGGGTAAGE